MQVEGKLVPLSSSIWPWPLHCSVFLVLSDAAENISLVHMSLLFYQEEDVFITLIKSRDL